MNTIPMSREVELHTRLFERIQELDEENQCLRSGWLSIMFRLKAMQLRRVRWIAAGAVAGAVAGWVVDGSVAQVVDRALRAVGI